MYINVIYVDRDIDDARKRLFLALKGPFSYNPLI